MKIEKWVTVEKEIEVDVNWEDIKIMLAEAEDGGVVLEIILYAWSVLKAAPHEILQPKQREHIANGLRALCEEYDRELDNPPPGEE